MKARENYKYLEYDSRYAYIRTIDVPKEKRITLYKKLWCKIRYWQSLKDITDTELSSLLQVGERTLKEYDKSAKNLTIEKN